MNAEQSSKIAVKDKKDLLSDQCKEIEENNRMGNTRDSFKKIRDTKGTFQAKMGSMRAASYEKSKPYCLNKHENNWLQHPENS